MMNIKLTLFKTGGTGINNFNLNDSRYIFGGKIKCVLIWQNLLKLIVNGT